MLCASWGCWLSQAKKLQKHNANAWLLNTGWISGGYGMEAGRRIPLKYTRAMVDAIHDGSLAKAEFEVSLKHLHPLAAQSLGFGV